MSINKGRAAKRSFAKRAEIKFHQYPHIPMKKESKVLRRLMSETGLTEQQLREHSTYRKQLSDAQVVPHYRYGNNEKIIERCLRSVVKQFMEKHDVTSPWDERVQQDVIEHLSRPNSIFSIYRYQEEMLALFKRKYVRKSH